MSQSSVEFTAHMDFFLERTTSNEIRSFVINGVIAKRHKLPANESAIQSINR